MGFLKYFIARYRWFEILGAAIFASFIVSGISLFVYMVAITPPLAYILGGAIALATVWGLCVKGGVALFEAIDDYRK
jgi:hypothetical protein